LTEVIRRCFNCGQPKKSLDREPCNICIIKRDRPCWIPVSRLTKENKVKQKMTRKVPDKTFLYEISGMLVPGKIQAPNLRRAKQMLREELKTANLPNNTKIWRDKG